MAGANSRFPPEGVPRNSCPAQKGYNTLSARISDLPGGTAELRDETPVSWKQTRPAAAHAARLPAMPSRSLRCVSFTAVFLAMFTVHLHVASLSILYFRDAFHYPIPDHEGEAQLPKEAVSTAAAPSSRVSSSTLTGGYLLQAATVSPPHANLDFLTRSPSAVTFLPGAKRLFAAKERASSSSLLHVSFPGIPRASTATHVTPSMSINPSSSADTLEPSSAEAYFFRVIKEALIAPSPVPQDVVFSEDILIAWHLLFQAIGCLLYGAVADRKGRRWVLNHTIQVLAVASSGFTVAALTRAHLMHPLTAGSNAGASGADTSALHDGDEMNSVPSSDGKILEPLPSSCFESNSGDKKRLDSRGGWGSASVGLQVFRELVRVSSWLVHPTLQSTLTIVSALCFSLAAVACGGAAVVAQCLCFEAAAFFSPSSEQPVGSAVRQCHVARTQDSGKAEPFTVCETTSCAGPARSGEPSQVSRTHCVDCSSIERTADSALTSVFSADAPFTTTGAQKIRNAELRWPLLASGQVFPAERTSTNSNGAVVNRFCSQIRILSVALVESLTKVYVSVRALWYAMLHWMLSSAQKLLLKVSKAPFFFCPSPYAPLAYLIGTQSAAHLFMLFLVSTVLHTLSSNSSSPGLTPSSRTPDSGIPLTPFPLFCLCFSLPVLPFCILLCVFINCRLCENPTIVSQRKNLLRQLRVLSDPCASLRLTGRRRTAATTYAAASLPLRRHCACVTVARAAERSREMVDRLSKATCAPCTATHHLISRLKKREFHSSQKSVLASFSTPWLSRSAPGRVDRRFGMTPLKNRRPCHFLLSLIPRRRGLSWGGKARDACVSEKGAVADLRLRVVTGRNPFKSALMAKRSKRSYSPADAWTKHKDVACQDSGDECIMSQTIHTGSHSSHRRLPSFPFTCSVPGAVSLEAAEEVGPAFGRREMTDGTPGNATRQQRAGADISPPASCCCLPCSSSDCGGMVGARKSLQIYRSYLGCVHSTSLRGLMLPCAFIGAAFYLRGIFRFLLLDCVVTEQENERLKAATGLAEDSRNSVQSITGNNVVPMKAPPALQVKTDMLPTSISCTSPSTSTRPCFYLAKRQSPMSHASAGVTLFWLSAPVLFVRIGACLVSVVLLSVLPPKLLQMLGCIFCAFMSFGTAVTLEALAQNFPDFPPISAAKTASVLYEIVFCCCCAVPAFTAVLLPMQSFHTGVRCGLAGAVLACLHAAAAVSLMGSSALLCLLTDSLYMDDSSTKYVPAVAGASSIPGVDRKGGSINVTSTPAKDFIFDSTEQSPTSSTDPCSGDAAVIAVVTCTYYVLAAAFTLLYTTHVRMPRVPVVSQIEKAIQRPQPQAKQLEARSAGFLNGRRRNVQQGRSQSQRWTTQWETEKGGGENPLLALDDVLLQKLSVSLVSELIDERTGEEDVGRTAKAGRVKV